MTNRVIRPAIVTPFLDSLMCGGLSILMCGGLLTYGFVWPESYDGLDSDTISSWKVTLLLVALINYPHFVASYRLLYSSRENMKRFPWAALYVPGLLIVLAVVANSLLMVGDRMGGGADRFAEVMGTNGPAEAILNNTCWAIGSGIDTALIAVSIIYLAWHYNGQAWGMTASFAYIGGVRFDATERRMIRAAYRAMLGTHVLWLVPGFLSDVERNTGMDVTSIRVSLEAISYIYFAIAALVTIPSGLLGFQRAARRTGKQIPWRSVLPWVSIYFWYLLLYVHVYFFLVIQLAHAFQYLSFPLRVDLNRYDRAAPHSAAIRACRVTMVYLLLFAGGLILLWLPGELEYSGYLPSRVFSVASTISIIVNIHHYFVDGAIWKISNPDVRRDLFSHTRYRS